MPLEILVENAGIITLQEKDYTSDDLKDTGLEPDGISLFTPTLMT